MKRKGLDSAESWAIAAASIVINFLILAPARLSGVLFVAFMDRFNVNREQASLPFTLCYILRTLPGPLAGYLAEKCGLRRMSIIGCVLATVGVAASFLAEDIITVTVLLGGCYGLGYGFVCSLIPEFLNQYFDKHLAKANGLTMGGAGLGAFLLPPVVEVLIYVYGVSGMLLILGGLVLHSVPATMLLRKADFDKVPAAPKNEELAIKSDTDFDSFPVYEKQKQRSKSLNINSTTETIEKANEICDILKLPTKKVEFVLPDNNIPEVRKYALQITKQNSLSSIPVSSNRISNIINSCNSSIPLPAESQNSDSLPRRRSLLHRTSTPLLLNIQNLKHSIDIKDFHFDIKKKPDERFEKLLDTDIEAPVKSKPKLSAVQSFRVFLDPAFLLISITQSTYFFIMFLIWTIIVDFVRDKGIPPDEEVYFVMCLSLSDTLGRLGLGWITDSKFLTKSNYSALCFLGMGVMASLLPLVTGFAVTLTTVFIYGLISGGVMIIFPGMVTQFIHKDLRTMAMASRTSLNAPMSMAISPMIGYFRGNLGSYDWIFYIVTIMSLMCCFTSYFTPIIARIRDNRRKKQEQTSHLGHLENAPV
ncbi:uncharacterized protein CDAR_32071 [Caerostris darwini]|uniref:Uncharacterized protein n=1 Tax=Caerostris darwini TaxID=1538125 RepID=A0AAV4RTF4_9ARAC|nr:uncharacterized protein CDAR_32071 [Caerostris darwini]